MHTTLQGGMNKKDKLCTRNATASSKRNTSMLIVSFLKLNPCMCQTPIYCTSHCGGLVRDPANILVGDLAEILFVVFIEHVNMYNLCSR